MNVLNRLINNASLLNVKNIVIPCVDQSSLKNTENKNNFINNIKQMVGTAERADINISLETDLAPVPFANLTRLN